MQIAVQPTTFRVPGKGDVSINLLEVRVASYSLGVGATSFYDLQTKSTVTKTREVPNPAYVPAGVDADGKPVAAVGTPTVTETYTEDVVTSYGLCGNNSLTEEQFNSWGSDDQHFAESIAANLGLTPA